MRGKVKDGNMTRWRRVAVLLRPSSQ